MTARSYTIDLDQLDSVTAQLGGLVDFVSGNLDELDAMVAQLDVAWSGTAADAQSTAQREWQAAAKDLRDGIIAMRLAASQAHENYSGAIGANLRILQRAAR